MGVLPLREALRIAQEHGSDLVEVAPNVEPPVCRLLDYGKFKYEQAKKERLAHKRQKTVELRQVRMRPKIGEHDIAAKIRVVRKLLDEGNKVKILVLFRGREVTHPYLGKDLIDRVAREVEGEAVVERPLAMEGRNMSIILSPTKKPRKERDAQAQDSQGD